MKKTLCNQVLLSLIFYSTIINTSAAEIDQEVERLLNLSLNEIMDINVTSVSKKAEKLSGAAAAIYVITSDDIKKSGLQTIPEILRLAPGVQVSQAGTSRWSISVRGFANQFANKLLVLMDGRTLYTPIFSGVYWDQQDTVIEDIDRIEIIRGPGATLWGANAVNGVINIITKKANNTNGLLFIVGAGDQEKGFSSLRYGGTTDNDLSYRTYLKYFYRDGTIPVNSENHGDDWHDSRGGFRLDKKVSEDSDWILQGDIYSSRHHLIVKEPTLTAPYSTLRPDDEETSGGNLMFKLNHKFNNGSFGSWQTYYDIVNRSGFPTATQEVKIFDTEIQHILSPIKNNEITWGLGYRNIESETESTGFFDFIPRYRNQHFFNSFIQDKISLFDNKLITTIGSKFEHNPYTEFETQPSIRSAYAITPSQTVWGSISRAVRIPNRAIDDISFVIAGTPGGFLSLRGNRDAVSEELTSYEMGYRAKVTEDIFADIAVYYNDYDKLSSNVFITSLQGISANEASGRTYGGELAINWDVNKIWDLDFTYSFIDIQLDNGNESGVNAEGKTSRHQYGLRSTLNLPKNISMNNQLYYASKLTSFNIDSYLRFDSNLSWKPRDNFEVSLIGQNLFDDYHPEFGANTSEVSYEVSRSVFFKLTYNY